NIPAVLEENKPDLKAFYKKKHSNLCFASAAKTEVKVNSKKLIGSAQHLFRNSILQHGSILIGKYHTKIVDIMKLQERERERFLKIIEASTFEIEELNNRVTPEILAKKILDIMETNGINFSMLQLTEKHLSEIEKIKEKFKVSYEAQSA
ncbi:MAG: lipoate--protein ligase family protein, partial [Calditrichia bacterium]|nr:lipoate--protein ligase family protein [Calditrichia bacterium]